MVLDEVFVLIVWVRGVGESFIACRMHRLCYWASVLPDVRFSWYQRSYTVCVCVCLEDFLILSEEATEEWWLFGGVRWGVGT